MSAGGLRLFAVAGLALLTASCQFPDAHWVEVGPRERGEYRIDRYEPGSPEGPVLHAIGIYEGSSDHDSTHSPRATVTITIEDQGPQAVYLALSSYEPVKWHLSSSGASAVKGVYLGGYNAHTVTGGASNLLIIDETLKTPRTYTSSNSERIACAITYRSPDGGGCEAGTGLTDRASALLNVKLTSFTGVYNAQSFTIHASGPKAASSSQPCGQSSPNPWSAAPTHADAPSDRPNCG